jgi:GT2 family glycosyltransferase
MYGEEVDLYLRLAQKLSKQVSYDPAVYATHLGRSSSTKAATNVLIEEIKGIEHIYAKHYPSHRSFAHLVIKLGVLLRIAVFSIIPSRAASVLEYKKLL